MNTYICLYSAFHFFLKNFFLRVVSTLLLLINTEECIFTFHTHTHTHTHKEQRFELLQINFL